MTGSQLPGQAAPASNEHHNNHRSPTPEEADRLALQRQKSIEQAIDEGHDADIPSDIGYVLDEQGEKRRKDAIRRNSLARARSHASHTTSHHHHDHDVEKEAAGDSSGAVTSSSEEDEANIIWWTENDPENPFNWPRWVKILNVGLISAQTFIAPLASSIFAPGVPSVMKEFHNSSPELASFVVSVYILGFAAGPLVIAPLSEIYGRLIVYHGCNVCFIAFLIACAEAPSFNALIAFRFLSGIFGSCAVTNGGGTISDMITQEKRATAMALMTMGVLLGPIIAPIIGGVISSDSDLGWRWVFWIVTILAGVVALCMLVFGRESYAPVLLQRRVDRLRKETGNEMLRSKLDIGLSPKDYFKRSIVRPLKMLVFSPICIIYAIYIAIVYGYLYLMFTTISRVFTNPETYNFGTKIVGLVFIGLGVGSLMGLVFFSVASNRIVKAKVGPDGKGTCTPEDRLKVLPVGAIFLPAGFFIYGWTAQYHVHWIVPVMSHALIGFGNIIIFMAITMALIDTFTIYAASALAANTVARSVFGAVLPIFGLRMYDTLGLGWGNSLLAFIAVALIPVPFLLIRYGALLRTRYEIKNL
ncbi:major facilitator superfamily domain-containing protein [Neurospora tetraspora]|uniref:Major facilitator superfamily domain-containing protein n=1 Tax=Neurospora tetraspora TaxID=94610 RepID=A0AAE0MTJ6_9PEZI|nr:major facilitator superfamily domain-containing protein [Neurospora tetraspora]